MSETQKRYFDVFNEMLQVKLKYEELIVKLSEHTEVKMLIDDILKGKTHKKGKAASAAKSSPNSKTRISSTKKKSSCSP